MRADLSEEESVLDSLAGGSSRVVLDGQSRHVMGYLQEFLFTPDRARTPVGALSGGERNRLLLARLFARPSNLLVMDEPTNDLDVETLELLEERLQAYQGTLLLVSHDRTFLNNVVTSCLVFEGEGRVAEYVGGYDDWVRQRPAARPRGRSAERAEPGGADRSPAPAPARERSASAKLGYKEQRELEALPEHIEVMETELEELQGRMAEPGFFSRPGPDIAAAKVRLTELGEALAAAYERWEYLESRRLC
jgi:ATP-binding cassette subfamily F protein uup